jgi:hypothetical protein
MDKASHLEQGHMSGRTRWVLVGFLAIALFFLLSEHRAHLLGILPYLLLFACPLMHLFHHHGHGGHAAPGPVPRLRRPAPPSGMEPRERHG